jgi:thiol-disulfide isomerase/thioredoxin
MRLKDPIPNLDGASLWLNGRVTKKELLNGKPTLIHFWSVSCSTCKDTMPKVNQLCEIYRDKLNVLSVHMPLSKNDVNIEQIKKIARIHHITHPIYVDNSTILSDRMNNQYVPSYYLFDRNGLLRHVHSGGGGIKTLEKRIQRVLMES